MGMFGKPRVALKCRPSISTYRNTLILCLTDGAARLQSLPEQFEL